MREGVGVWVRRLGVVAGRRVWRILDCWWCAPGEKPTCNENRSCLLAGYFIFIPINKTINLHFKFWTKLPIFKLELEYLANSNICTQIEYES